jgi:predicted outer membrane protein
LSQHIAVCLALGNQEEVALGQFAKDRAQNPEVKQFAQMMVQEHQQAISQLQQASPQLASMNLNLSAQGGATPGAASASNSNRGAGAATTSSTPTAGSSASTSANQRNTATADGGADGQTQQHVQFAQEVKQQCLQLTTAELGRKQGAEFDKAYIGQQLVAHTQMLATLQAAQRHASSELQPIIQQGTQMTEHHLAQARQIMEQLSAGGAAGGQAPRQSAAQTPPRS